MRTRRSFIRLALRGTLLSPIALLASRARAAGRRVLEKGTPRESLIQENPAALDTANLEITPLEAFGTMGPTNKVVDPGSWRLEVSGSVKRPASLTYPQILALPAIEREVLLICPGFFANHGRWKGISIAALLLRVEADRSAVRLVVEARGQKSVRFPLADILSDKVFLAHRVNGQELPRRHGFPLRVVAEGYYGSDWVKYVDRVSVETA